MAIKCTVVFAWKTAKLMGVRLVCIAFSLPKYLIILD